MTDFAVKLRHQCRNCRTKLSAPVANEREAFCCRGCYNSFYLHCCRVCECQIEQPKRGQRLICKKAKCKQEWRSKSGFGRFSITDPSAAGLISESPVNTAVGTPVEPDRKSAFVPGPHDRCAVCGRDNDSVDRKVPDGWVTVCSEHDKPPFPKAVPERHDVVEADENPKPAAEHWTGTWNVLRVIAAGAPITASVYHCAAVSAGEAIAEDARTNAAHWRAAKARKLGYRRHHAVPRPAVVVSNPAPAIPDSYSIPDDLSIPEFLRRDRWQAQNGPDKLAA